MIKKTRLSFSSISKDANANAPVRHAPHNTTNSENRTEQHTGEKRKPMKSSTYQYTKKRFGGPRGVGKGP